MSTLTEETVSIEELSMDIGVNMFIGEGNLGRYLKLVGDRKGPLIKYHEGSLTLVSPSSRHENGAERIDGVTKAVCAVLDIDYIAFASTLFRKPGRDHGIEGDKTYYLANSGAMVNVRDEIDLSIYPPPDLVLESVYSNSPQKSLRIYQELEVPEVWVYRVKKRTLEFLHLGADGRYAPQPASRPFSFLSLADVLPWIDKPLDEPDNRWERRVREWVRAEVAPATGLRAGRFNSRRAPGDAS